MIRFGSRLRGVLLLVFLSASCLRADDPVFTKHVKPFLASYCVSCHGAKNPKGEIRVDQLGPEFKDREEIELWGSILAALEFGEMPLDTAKKFPTKNEVHAVETWIAEALHLRGIDVADKSEEEGFGNLVPHELLFSPAERNRPIDAAARLWRISPKTLEHLLRAGGGARIVSNPFALDKPHGNFRDFKSK
ncbi:MAG: hypothetical protein N2C14_29585, partial [Planctomycetales bacterium]